nr:zinc finger BED domain-containing protein RICESLEEPER 2 [Tanacetum cinerariifolium]
MSSEYERYINSDFVTHLHPKEFASFDVLGFWKEKETMFSVLSRMAIDLISIQASSVASESAFSTSGRVLSIRRTRLTTASLEMCMCLKDHLDAKERKEDKCPLEIPLDFEEDVFDDEVQRNEAISLSDQEIALDASSEGTLSLRGPRGVRDEEVVVGEGVVRFSSSFMRSTNGCSRGMMRVNKANGRRSACTRGPFAISIIIVKMRGGWLVEGGGRRNEVTTSSRATILYSISLLMSGKRIHDTIIQDIGLTHNEFKQAG